MVDHQDTASDILGSPLARQPPSQEKSGEKRMTPEAFTAAVEALHWNKRLLSTILECDDQQVRRWASGKMLVPRSVEAWLLKLAAFHNVNPPPQDWRSRARRAQLEAARADG